MHCSTERMTIGLLWVDKNKMDIDPPYQRESGVWAVGKKQLFIDSLVNEFDIPKIYIHDLRDQEQSFQYAAIDGKQRLSAMWDFLDNKIPLADDFKYFGSEDDAPAPGHYFRDFSDRWQERFKAISLDTVQVRNADEQDIEELFSRLNNGEPLNAAEARNALGGDMCRLIREIAEHRFFKKIVKFPNKRYAHFGVSAKLLRIEHAEAQGMSGDGFCDLQKKHLDNLVKDNKRIPDSDQERLKRQVSKNLDLLCKAFDEKDSNLSGQSYPQMYYLFVKGIHKKYAHARLHAMLKEFFPRFTAARKENNEKNEDDRDWDMSEYGQLTQQGSNSSHNMSKRNEILQKFFLTWYPAVTIKEPRRRFSDAERHVLWIRSDKKCSICGLAIDHYKDVDADHIEQWSTGGETTLENARAACVSCNRSRNQRTQ